MDTRQAHQLIIVYHLYDEFSWTKKDADFTLEAFPEGVFRMSQAILIVHPFENVQPPSQT